LDVARYRSLMEGLAIARYLAVFAIARYLDVFAIARYLDVFAIARYLDVFAALTAGCVRYRSLPTASHSEQHPLRAQRATSIASHSEHFQLIKTLSYYFCHNPNNGALKQ
jgi:hypothetical protein